MWKHRTNTSKFCSLASCFTSRYPGLLTAHFATAVTHRRAPLPIRARVAIIDTATTVTDRHKPDRTGQWSAGHSPPNTTLDGGSGEVSMSTLTGFSHFQALPLPTHQPPLRTTQAGIAQSYRPVDMDGGLESLLVYSTGP